MIGKLLFDRHKIRFWLIAAALYLTVIYSTSLHWLYVEHTLTVTHLGFWSLASFDGDMAAYIAQANGLSTEAPYRYRFLPTWIIGAMAGLSGLPIAFVFVAANILLIWLAALLFTGYLLDDFKPQMALFGGVLFVSMVSVTRTILFPMLEPASLFFAIILAIAIKKRSVWLFIAASVCGVATKEILIVFGLPWLLYSRGKAKFTAVIPVVAFSSIRLLMGGGLLEVNYGFNLLDGQWPDYGGRLFQPYYSGVILIAIALSFGVYWMAWFSFHESDFLVCMALIIPVVIIAAILLSSRIARNLGVLYPVIIPGFLYYLGKLRPP